MIKIYNRKTKEYEIEKVAGGNYLNWMYSSPVGMSLLELAVKKKFFSILYGRYCDTSWSARKIPSFVKEFDIDMSHCEPKDTEYKSFNEFFIRKLSPKVRPVDMNSSSFVSPGDGRLLVYENIDLEKLVQIKGFTYSFKELLATDSLAEQYDKGICLILRLSPVDYHRFHFVDSGSCSDTKKITGSYYSVNPVALNSKKNLYCRNKREWSIFHSDNFGDILHVEVGATCVGTIIQSYTPNTPIKKGEEKGYFKFGGSTTLLFLQKDTVVIDKDILEQSTLGYETKVMMGEKIGTKK
jgi:phosphatidylserine decarboxylase